MLRVYKKNEAKYTRKNLEFSKKFPTLYRVRGKSQHLTFI